jgi:hypothetical protein
VLIKIGPAPFLWFSLPLEPQTCCSKAQMSVSVVTPQNDMKRRVPPQCLCRKSHIGLRSFTVKKHINLKISHWKTTCHPIRPPCAVDSALPCLAQDSVAYGRDFTGSFLSKKSLTLQKHTPREMRYGYTSRVQTQPADTRVTQLNRSLQNDSRKSTAAPDQEK